MITRARRSVLALGVLVPLTLALLPSPRARADEGVGWLLAGGELLVLGGSIATTIAISADEDPSAAILVTHFTLAAANIGIGAAIIGLGLSIEAGANSFGSAIRTFVITFGVLQLLNGVIMGVLGALIAAAGDDDEAATPAMLAPLTLRF